MQKSKQSDHPVHHAKLTKKEQFIEVIGNVLAFLLLLAFFLKIVFF